MTPEWFARLPGVVGRCGAEALGAPNAGLGQLAKACRQAGGWFLWSTEGHIVKPVKVTAAAESGTGKAVYRDEKFPRVHLKGRHRDGRGFAVRYVEGKPDIAYVLTHEHRATTDDGEVVEWRTERPHFAPSTVTKVKEYVR